MPDNNPSQSHPHPQAHQHQHGHQVASGKQPADRQHSQPSQHHQVQHDAEVQERRYEAAKEGATDFADWSEQKKTEHKEARRQAMKDILKAPGRKAKRILGFGGPSKSKQLADAQTDYTLSENSSHYFQNPGCPPRKYRPSYMEDHTCRTGR